MKKTQSGRPIKSFVTAFVILAMLMGTGLTLHRAAAAALAKGVNEVTENVVDLVAPDRLELSNENLNMDQAISPSDTGTPEPVVTETPVPTDFGQIGTDEPDGDNNQEGTQEIDGSNNQVGTEEVDGSNNEEGTQEVDGENPPVATPMPGGQNVQPNPNQGDGNH